MKKHIKVMLLGMGALTVALNILAWNSTAFCDFYAAYVFPVWVETYGRFTSLFSFSVGEIMIALLLAILLLSVLPGMAAILFFFYKTFLQSRGREIKRPFFLKISSVYFQSLLGLFVLISLVMTLNCFILYHTSTFREKYMSSGMTQSKEYSIEELGQLRDFIVVKANQYAKQMERDENGRIVYDGNMEEEAIRSMRNLSLSYPQLDGFYPTPKKLYHSDFLCQQYMQGYYFPFSMEANYNDRMYIMCKPATMCHELAHTKGFIYEDEANLLGFLACIYSDDPVFQYSGYLSVLTYIDRDFKESLADNPDAYRTHVKISSQVKKDRVFLTEDAWESVEKKAIVSTETVKKASGQFLETSLVLNGVEQGKASYCEVVGLLMDYYTELEEELSPRKDYLAWSE